MICSTCEHATPWKDLGFIRCRYLPAWVYVAEESACRFTPIRWLRKETQRPLFA